MWQYTGQERPPFAEEPLPGQESVWDYPRPPALVGSDALVEVFDGHSAVASTRSAMRVLETASPPTYYLPPASVDRELLIKAPGSSFCEWKGAATYWRLADAPGGAVVAWSYDQPSDAFLPIRNYLSFYPALLTCMVNGEQAQPQPGGFYGGWVTPDLAGPFKGEIGTGHW